MRVRASLYGTTRRLSNTGKPGRWEGEMPEGSTVADLINAIGSNQREVNAAAVNGVNVPFDTVIDTNMDIVLVTVVGGG